MINKEKSLLYYLEDLSHLEEISATELDSWITQRPYCQNLRMLRAKKSFDPRQDNNEAVVEQASFYSIDRPRLYHFLHDLYLVRYVESEKATHKLEPKVKSIKKASSSKKEKLAKTTTAATLGTIATAKTPIRGKVDKPIDIDKLAKHDKSTKVYKPLKVDKLDPADDVVLDIVEATPLASLPKISAKKAAITAPPTEKTIKNEISLTEALEKNEDIRLGEQSKKKKRKKKKLKKKSKQRADLDKKQLKAKKKKKKKKKKKLELINESSIKKKPKNKTPKNQNSSNKSPKAKNKGKGKNKKQKLELEPKDKYELAVDLPLSESADMSFTEWLMHIRTAGGKFDIPYQDFSKDNLRVTTATTKKKKKKKSDKVSKIAMQSVAADNEIISVELADLLAMQGKHKKAIKMYEKLSLIFPKKNSFFAAKIDKLVK